MENITHIDFTYTKTCSIILAWTASAAHTITHQIYIKLSQLFFPTRNMR